MNPTLKQQKSPKTKQERLSPEGVSITNPQRVLYRATGDQPNVTKMDLVDYYLAVQDYLLPYVADRPLTIVRCPEGHENECFFQKHLTESLPDALVGIPIREKEKERIYLSLRDAAGLISLVQLGTLEIHPWGSRSDRLDRPDQIIFDLDPDERIEFGEVVEAALDLREVLEHFGLRCFVRTTGGKGLHVVVPIQRRSSWDQVKQFSRNVAVALARREPDRFVATSNRKQRRGRIYIDYLRNSQGATAVASYSTRARPGAPVATPLEWSELEGQLDPSAFHIRSVPARLDRLPEIPWSDFGSTSQSLTKAMQKASENL